MSSIKAVPSASRGLLAACHRYHRRRKPIRTGHGTTTNLVCAAAPFFSSQNTRLAASENIDLQTTPPIGRCILRRRSLSTMLGFSKEKIREEVRAGIASGKATWRTTVKLRPAADLAAALEENVTSPEEPSAFIKALTGELSEEEVEEFVSDTKSSNRNRGGTLAALGDDDERSFPSHSSASSTTSTSTTYQ